MLSNLDGLLDEAVTGCHGFKNENRDGTDDATHCNQVRKISCHGCRGCHGGFDSARDAKTLIQALNAAGPAGLNWREGTPNDWDDVRLLAAGEVLYANGRMVNVLGRRYLTTQAPRLPGQDRPK